MPTPEYHMWNHGPWFAFHPMPGSPYETGHLIQYCIDMFGPEVEGARECDNVRWLVKVTGSDRCPLIVFVRDQSDVAIIMLRYTCGPRIPLDLQKEAAAAFGVAVGYFERAGQRILARIRTA